MATIVGATLASSKLEVTQDDLHLIGSSVDQLVVQFDQMAIDEFLPADQIRAGKKHLSKARAAASISTASSSSVGSTPVSDSESICAPERGKQIPWASVNR